MINLSINGQRVSVQPGTTVLEAARKLNINIPTLSNHPDLCVAGNSRKESSGMPQHYQLLSLSCI